MHFKGAHVGALHLKSNNNKPTDTEINNKQNEQETTTDRRTAKPNMQAFNLNCTKRPSFSYFKNII